MASNITVTIRLRDKVSSPLDKVGRSAGKTESRFQRMGATASAVASHMKRDFTTVATSGGKLNKINLSPLRKQFINVSRTVQGLNRNTNALTQTVARLAATYLGVMGAKAAINLSDTIVSAKNRIGDQNGTGWDSAETQESLDKIYTASNRARTSYSDMMKNVGKLMANASEAFDDNIDNAIRFQETMAKAYAVSGASAEEQASSMYQLIQALGSGVLQGDELRSVREGATGAYKEIEKFAQGVLHSDESLKDLASDGLITSDLVVAAIMNASDSIDERFAKTRLTFGQMWAIFKNDTIKAFEPVSQKLNDIMNSDSFQQIVGYLSSGIQSMAGALMIVLNIAQMGIDFIADHWNIAGKIILFFLGLIVASLIIYAVKGIWAFVSVGLKVLWQIGYIIALTVWYAILGVAAWVSALMQGSAWAFVVLAIILVVAAILRIAYAYSKTADVAFSVIGAIVGALYFLGSVIYDIGAIIGNIVIALAKYIIWAFKWAVLIVKGVLAGLALVGINVAEAIANGFISAVESFVNFFLDGINLIIAGWNKLMDLLPDEVKTKLGLSKGESLGLSLGRVDFSGAKNSVTDWLKDTDLSEPNVNYVGLKNPLESYKKGYEIGSNFQNKIGNGISDKISSIMDKLGKGTTGKKKKYASATPDMSNIGKDYGNGSSKVGNIDKNTKKIADNTSNLDEDFSYLIELAERDTINRFTTATIKVEMNNTNQIKERADVDGIINTLSSRLKEELDVVAAGTHY